MLNANSLLSCSLGQPLAGQETRCRRCAAQGTAQRAVGLHNNNNEGGRYPWGCMQMGAARNAYRVILAILLQLTPYAGALFRAEDRARGAWHCGGHARQGRSGRNGCGGVNGDAVRRYRCANARRRLRADLIYCSMMYQQAQVIGARG